MDDGQWHFVALTRSGTTLKAYLDGQDATSVATNPAAMNPDTTLPLLFGKGTNPVDPYVGQLDEIEIFDRALDASEISDIYNAGSAGKCKGCQLDLISVDHFAGGPYSLDGKPTTMNAAFVPTDADDLPVGLTDAATTCGFTGFNWQQEVAFLPAPSPFFPFNPSVINPANLSANRSLQAPPSVF